WPMGSPKFAPEEDETPDFGALQDNTYTAFADMDASPTKAWLITHRHDPKWRSYYDIAFAKRAPEELYDVKKDPDMVDNLAGNSDFRAAKEKMSVRLMQELTRAKDPRVIENPPRFEQPPFTDGGEGGRRKK